MRGVRKLTRASVRESAYDALQGNRQFQVLKRNTMIALRRDRKVGRGVPPSRTRNKPT